MRWLWPLFGLCVIVMMTTTWGFGHLGWPIFVGPVLWMVLGNGLRCPRCRRFVLDNAEGYYAPWLKTPKTCVGCGRRKDDIWPFQFLIRPERPR